MLAAVGTPKVVKSQANFLLRLIMNCDNRFLLANFYFVLGLIIYRLSDVYYRMCALEGLIVKALYFFESNSPIKKAGLIMIEYTNFSRKCPAQLSDNITF